MVSICSLGDGWGSLASEWGGVSSGFFSQCRVQNGKDLISLGFSPSDHWHRRCYLLTIG
jgi:hypothetical protein